jgi:hypothetical protein
MKLLQVIVFTLVLFGNEYWKWTPNPYLAGGMGIGAAFLVTVALVRVGDLLRAILNLRKRHAEQRKHARVRHI